MALSPGSRLGPYEILSPIGAGGMGEVYRARDPRLGRDVAIKVLPASFSGDADRLRRFEQEARAAGILNHPNIVAVHDVGTHDGSPYVVEELLEGETLRSVLARGALAARKAVEYAREIAQGLAAAHDKGIVHRDLKPENVFVTNDGRIKILDFGLAKLTLPEAPAGMGTHAPTQTAATEAGVVLGTVGYMAPEQVRGQPADARTDIFAAGTILYEMLSGRRAFLGKTPADTMSAILTADPPELTEIGRRVPPGLERILRHCLEKNPEERFQSARDLAFALSAAAAGAPTRAGRVSWRRFALAAGVGVAALAIVAAALLWRARRVPSAPASGAGRKSIAVLPFENLSPDPQNAYFADGMTEDILTQLAKVRDLKVISRTSTARYKGTQKPIPAIAAELGVATVLEGSVRRAGDRVRIVGQLVDGRTDEHLWAETYDRDLRDIFAIQSEVAQKIAGALQATLSPAEKKRIEQSPTANVAAYDVYLKGRELYAHYRNADNESAIEFFQHALEMDPKLAIAYAGLADAYAQRVVRFSFPPSWVDESLRMSRRAVTLDPDLAEGYKAIGLAYFAKGAYRESMEESKRAVEINPSHSAAIANVGVALALRGAPDEALPWLRRAAELDPNAAVDRVLLGGCYAELGDASRAEQSMKDALRLQPELGQAYAWLVCLYLEQHRDADALRLARSAMTGFQNDPRMIHIAAIAELIAGDAARAERLFEQVVSQGLRQAPRNAGAGPETYLALLRIRAGRRAEAATLLDTSLAINRRATENGSEDWSIPFDTACVHAIRGEKDEAFRSLEKAIDAGWRGWPLGTRSPLLDPLRSDPRFAQIETRLETMVARMRRQAGLS